MALDAKTSTFASCIHIRQLDCSALGDETHLPNPNLANFAIPSKSAPFLAVLPERGSRMLAIAYKKFR
ncbi:hypothetical protein D3C77_435270 [compost metagenome]